MRVWGGGRYESDAFYETCDRLGILVWQEMMFACANYPRDQTFLKTVAAEVAAQVRRLRKHVSIVIWGGNNEVESMWDQFQGGAFIPPGDAFDRDISVVDFVKIFIDTIEPLVRTLDSTRPFVDTSPSNGLISREPYVKRWGNTSSTQHGYVEVDIYIYISIYYMHLYILCLNAMVSCNVCAREGCFRKTRFSIAIACFAP